MSAATKVLERARAAGVQLEARGGRLAYDAPPDVRERKAELLELLRSERREFLDLATDPEARAGWLSAPIGRLSASRVPPSLACSDLAAVRRRCGNLLP
jgi:hypothetical protein